MLAVAHASVCAEGRDNVVLVRGTALDLPFDDAWFSHANCVGALHLFPDVRRVLAEVRRVLARGARFTIGVFRRPAGQFFTWTAMARRRLLGVYAFRPEELEGLLQAAGFAAVRTLHESRGWLVVVAHAS
jgi:ubiquinone/menaquinone biosynthesis C-methylase UbiE